MFLFRRRISVETVSARAHGQRTVEVVHGQGISTDPTQSEEPQAPLDPRQLEVSATWHRIVRRLYLRWNSQIADNAGGSLLREVSCVVECPSSDVDVRAKMHRTLLKVVVRVYTTIETCRHQLRRRNVQVRVHKDHHLTTVRVCSSKFKWATVVRFKTLKMNLLTCV